MMRSDPKPEEIDPMTNWPRSDKKAQKIALLTLLRNRFDDVRTEARFEWLAVPPADRLDECLAAIHSKLRSHRGHDAFATEGFQPCCDFFVPKKCLLIEYDERQHFTIPRSMSLRLYPSDMKLNFDRFRWIDTCNMTKANDPTPPFRDEQRAFYDTLRDILAARNGYTLIRIMHGDFDWISPKAAGQLDTLLRQHGVEAGTQRIS